jgi:MbtH protein
MRAFVVVENRTGQYSIWPTDRELPPGWTPTGAVGDETSCLLRIDHLWTDLRPTPALAE